MQLLNVACHVDLRSIRHLGLFSAILDEAYNNHKKSQNLFNYMETVEGIQEW